MALPGGNYLFTATADINVSGMANAPESLAINCDLITPSAAVGRATIFQPFPATSSVYQVTVHGVGLVPGSNGYTMFFCLPVNNVSSASGIRNVRVTAVKVDTVTKPATS